MSRLIEAVSFALIIIAVMTIRKILALLLFCLLIRTSTFEVIDLGGQWIYYSTNKSVHGQGLVPGDIYSDLHRSGVIPDPLFADNHLHLSWIAADNWTYAKSFCVDQSILEYKRTLLILRGVDTISTVVLNGDTLLNTTNQFVTYSADLFGILKKCNTIEIRFTSPVLYAKQKSSEYHKNRGHLVPPVCPPPTYHGECHPNFIRKAQYSFSWDWGPAIPTVGISKDIQIVAFNDYFMDDFTWITERTEGMNILRVWGGGVYESEEFYTYADSKGILLWQIWRIKRHPSILLWAGNNENEIAIRSHWWTVENYTEVDQVKDYLSLYSGVVKPLVEDADPSRTFLLSSPSNGQKTEESTMLKHIDDSEWFYSSKQLVHRQHKPAAILTNLMMVFSHFPRSENISKAVA
ncbi:hypothetical protein OSTOST_14386 [Ostertagia ostertagi]